MPSPPSTPPLHDYQSAPAALGFQSSPAKRKIAHNTEEFIQSSARVRRESQLNEMLANTCQLSVKEFFQTCVASKEHAQLKSSVRKLARSALRKLKSFKSEQQLERAFLKALNDTVLKEAQYKLVDTSTTGKRNKFDASLVTCDVGSNVERERLTRGLQTASVPHDNVRVIAEFKTSPSSDPYGPYSQVSGSQQEPDPSMSQSKSQPRSRKRKEPDLSSLGPLTFGQIIDYAQDIMSSSHRTHFFEVWVGGKAARLFYFDRSGIIISEQFTYTEEPDIIIDFFWKFCHLSPSAQGFDDTVESASDEEVERSQARTLLASWSKPQSQFLKIKVYVQALGTSTYTDYQESEDTEVSSDVRTFIATEECLARPGSVQGRGTWCYAAVLLPEGDVASDGIVYCLKEAWRVPGVTPEWKYLQKLKDCGVKNVPRLYCGGVTPGRRTVAHTVSKILDERVQQRLATTPLGKTLDKFSSVQELFKAAYDAVEGHREATTLAGILHRDVSVNNILIHSSCGYLNDWDMAKFIEDTKVRQMTRTGTWPFMSIRLCEGYSAHTDIRDDLESVVWVLTYVIIRYLPHNHADQARSMLNDVFFSYINMAGGPLGGSGKRAFLRNNQGLPWVQTLKFSDDPIQFILTWMREALGTVVDEDSDRDRIARKAGQAGTRNPYRKNKMVEEEKPKIEPSELSQYEPLLDALKHVVLDVANMATRSRDNAEYYKLSSSETVAFPEPSGSSLWHPTKKARAIQSAGAAPTRRSGRLAAAEKRIIGGQG